MSKVKFKSDTHQYFADDRELISVSAFVKRFEEKKDWSKIAAKVAKKQGKTTKEILDLWEMKRVKGTEAGTIFHSIKEAELLNGEFFDYEQEKLAKRECEFDNQGGYKMSLPLEEIQNGFVYPELMIYDLEHMICGQSDKIIIAKNKINVYDYKTDKSIDFKAFSSDWVDPEKLKRPVHHLEACNGNIYSLKMSLYMYMLWKATKGRFKPGKIILEWCPLERDEDGIPILYDGKPKMLFDEPKQIELPYRKKEVMDMLATLK